MTPSPRSASRGVSWGMVAVTFPFPRPDSGELCVSAHCFRELSGLGVFMSGAALPGLAGRSHQLGGISNVETPGFL